MDYKHFFVRQSLQFVLLDYNYLKSFTYSDIYFISALIKVSVLKIQFINLGIGLL